MDLPAPQLAAGRHELVARGQHDGARPPRHAHGRQPEPSDGGDGERRQRRPGGEHGGSGAHVGAGGPHAVAGRDRAVGEHGAVPLARALDGQDRVGAVRQDAAGGDARGGPHRQRRRIVAGRRAEGDGQRPPGIGGAQRVAVERGVGPARQVVRRDDVGRQHAARGVRQRHVLGRQSAGGAEQQPACRGQVGQPLSLVDVHHGMFTAPDAGGMV